MIPVYDELIKNDSVTDLLNDYKYARFFSMVMTDSIKYKKEIYDYYHSVQQEQNLADLLKNPDVYKDQSEIYKRMTLSYYFEGREKTLEDFKSVGDVIPYKFKYDMILNNKKGKTEFLYDFIDW